MKPYDRKNTSFSTVIQVGVAFTWAGLVLGLSFIETPLKFQAPGVTNAIGVGIGRLIFTTLNRVELVLGAILLGTLILGQRNAIKYALVSLILAIVLTQTFWLLPVLDVRAQLLLDGHPAPPTSHHLLFVAIESLKVFALFALGIVAARRAV